MLEFKKLTLDSKSVFEKYTKFKYEASETSFANIFIWKDFFDVKYLELEDFLVVLYTDTKGKINVYMPYGEGNLKKCIDTLNEYFNTIGQEFKIISANEEMKEELQKLYPFITVKENRDFSDYVYTSEALINLSGKKLHSKRNHLNTFKNTYEYEYRKMTSDDFDECLALAKKIMLKNREEDSLSFKAEYRSLENMFNNFYALDVKGAVIVINRKIAAFSIGEKLNENCALIHIEKADTAYNGIYAAINNEFVKNEWCEFEYINREEDMGAEGLRKAKLSYRPHHMVKKYICEFFS